jgi:hypothetical protein
MLEAELEVNLGYEKEIEKIKIQITVETAILPKMKVSRGRSY